MTQAIDINLQHLTLGYGHRTLLNDVSATFGAGRLTALLGRNGAGKSTLLRALAGLEPVKGGDIVYGDRSLRQMSDGQRARTLSFVSPQRLRVSALHVDECVAMGRAPYTGWTGRLTGRDRQVVRQSLERVGMTDYARRTVDSLSDGERQRVMIARALAQDTPVILLDEPTSFLDLPNRHMLVRLLATLSHDDGKTIVFSTHELDIAAVFADTLAVIADCTLAVGTPDAMTAVLQQVFALPPAGPVTLSKNQFCNIPQKP